MKSIKTIEPSPCLIPMSHQTGLGRLRIVTGQASLREKIAIFNADLDDRVIELLKALVMLQIQDQLADKEVKGVYFIPGEDPHLEIVYDDGTGNIGINMESYNKIKEVFSDTEPFLQDNELYIDQAWAHSLIAMEQ